MLFVAVFLCGVCNFYCAYVFVFCSFLFLSFHLISAVIGVLAVVTAFQELCCFCCYS